MSDITNALNLPPELAIRFFKQKINVPAEKWDDLWNEQHTKGFMIAGAMKADLIQDFRDAVTAGIEDGESLEQFRARFDQIVEKHGWDYHGTRNWRSQVIFDTNVRTAYSAGRWQQMTDPEVLATRPFLQYRHGDSVKPRPLHLAWDKKILPATDPWWNEHYPPGGYGCKCKVYSLSKRDLLRKGKTGPDQAPDDGEYEVQDRRTGDMVKVPRGIDPGFAYNPGKDPGKAGKVLGNLLDRLDPDLRKKLIDDLGTNIGSKAKTRKKIIKDFVAEMPEEAPVVIPEVELKTAEEFKAYGKELKHRIMAEATEAAEKYADEYMKAFNANGGQALTGDFLLEFNKKFPQVDVQTRIIEELKKLRPFSKVAKMEGTGKNVQAVRDASTLYPDDWTDKSDQLGRLVIGQNKRGWHYYNSAPYTRDLGRGRRVAPGEGMITLDNGRKNTAIHEFAHRIQTAVPDLDNFFQEEHRTRTAGDPLERLKSLYPGSGYKYDEVTRKDKYIHYYQGKDYSGSAKEVVTMSYQFILGNNGADFARFMRDDPDLFDLSLGLLARYKP